MRAADPEKNKTEIQNLAEFLKSAGMAALKKIYGPDLLPLIQRLIQRKNTAALLIFIKKCLLEGDRKDAALLCHIPITFLVAALRGAGPQELGALLAALPEKTALYAARLLRDNQQAQTFLLQQWLLLRDKLVYAAFDLEIDPSAKRDAAIKQFAYIARSGAFAFNGEKHLGELQKALANAEIIIGHNIRRWDLPILAAKGIRPAPLLLYLG